MISKARIAAGASLLIAAALFTTGCTAVTELAAKVTEPSDAEVTTEMLSTAAPEPLWTAGAQSVGGGPTIVGETVVSHIFRDGSLTLVGYDLLTGEEKWAHAGVTGSVKPEAEINPRLIEAEDGSVVAVNILTPVNEDLPDGQGTRWRHPYQIIDVQTGSVVADKTEQVVFGAPLVACIIENVYCTSGIHNGGDFNKMAIDSQGNPIDDPQRTAAPEFNFADRAYEGGIFMGEAGGGTPAVARMSEGEVLWSVPLSELGIAEPKRTSEWEGYEGFATGAEWYEDENIVVIGGGNRIPNAEGFAAGTETSAGLNAETGEILWTAEGATCFEGVMCLGETTANVKDHVYSYIPADMPLAGFDPKTGETTWTTEVEGLELYNKDAWQTPGSAVHLINVAEGARLLNIEDGSLTAPTEDQRFACRQTGPSYSAPKQSRPTEANVDWTGNDFTGSCTVGSDEADLDPTNFTQGVVAAASLKPFTADTQWNVLEEQVRVIATKDGLAAYRF